jgi:ubiquinone/menaquinone biosynthesis C-methylase UbiE
MIVDTYKKYAGICVRFYELTAPQENVGNFIFEKSKCKPGQKVLFVGGMFHLAKALADRGLEVTVVDYTDEMVGMGRAKLVSIPVSKADLRSLPFTSTFDLIFAVGRVFTHMITEADLSQALNSCYRAVKPNGALFFDNYESSKIQRTTYFNGEVACSDGLTNISRRSSTLLLTETPHLVEWSTEYSGVLDGLPFHFRDSMKHRAFSRDEIARKLEDHKFKLVLQGDNFDETSFFTLATIG